MRNLSNLEISPQTWRSLVLFSIVFWLSSSLLLDFLVMPGLFVTGMMSQSDFGTAGYSLFWTFNRIELLCGAVILTGLLISRQQRSDHDIIVSGMRSRWAMELGLGLLAIALVYTYYLTPSMGALGVSLDAFQPAIEVPTGMNQLHGLYWGLEALKLLATGWLLRLCYRDLTPET